MKPKNTINVNLSDEAKQFLFDRMVEEDCSLSEIIERLIKKEQKDGAKYRVTIEDRKIAELREERLKRTWVPKNCYGEYNAKSLNCNTYCHGKDFCKSYTCNRLK